MLADGVCDVQGAARATWKAVQYAEGVPTAWADVPLPSLHGIPATLLANNFEGATSLAMTLTSAKPKEIHRRLEEKGYAERAAEFDKLQENIPTAAQQSTMRVIPLVPMAIRLAELRLHGWKKVETESALNDIERIMPLDKQPEAFGQALRRSFLEDVDWSILQQEGYDSMRFGQYARALTLLVGAMQRALINQSLYLQTYLAQNFEQWFGTARSIYRALVAPMFRAYWEHALATSTAFRTGMSYTNRQFELLDGTPGGTRKFLSAMRFCLGTSLPEETMNWLNRS